MQQLQAGMNKTYVAARKEICKECDKLTPKHFCSECGCFMPVKSLLPFVKCPLGKWAEAEVSQDDK